MYPAERSLVKTFAGRPFAIVGVNSDQTRELVKKAQEKESITWRSFYDGNQGPIADAYNIVGWPTVFILDHLGVMRSINPEEHEKVLEPLIKEAEKAKGRLL